MAALGNKGAAGAHENERKKDEFRALVTQPDGQGSVAVHTHFYWPYAGPGAEVQYLRGLIEGDVV